MFYNVPYGTGYLLCMVAVKFQTLPILKGFLNWVGDGMGMSPMVGV